eukprot:2754274-Rhodomonas_salina.4
MLCRFSAPFHFRTFYVAADDSEHVQAAARRGAGIRGQAWVDQDGPASPFFFVLLVIGVA